MLLVTRLLVTLRVQSQDGSPLRRHGALQMLLGQTSKMQRQYGQISGMQLPDEQALLLCGQDRELPQETLP